MSQKKRYFFQVVCVITTVWKHHVDFNETYGEKAT